jgi:hypothetical protein
MENQIISEVDKGKKAFYTDGYSMSIGEVVSMYKEGELIINPDFQRAFQWSVRQQSRLVESILLDIPIPSIFVFQNDKGKWEVVDGVQRISSILAFMGELKDENDLAKKIPPSKLEKTKHLPSLEGMSWDNLPKEPLQINFKRAKLDLIIIKSTSDKNAKFEVFQRLNAGGTLLSDQELRNCWLLMLDKGFHDWLRDTSNESIFMNCLNLSDKLILEKYHMELLLRLIVFPRYTFTQKKVDEYIDDSVTDILEKSILDLNNETKKIKAVFEILFKVAGENIFKRKSKGQFLESYFEAIAIGVYENITSFDLNTEEDIEFIKKKVEALEDEEDFTRFKGSGTNSTIRIPNVVLFGKRYFKK